MEMLEIEIHVHCTGILKGAYLTSLTGAARPFTFMVTKQV